MDSLLCNITDVFQNLQNTAHYPAQEKDTKQNPSHRMCGGSAHSPLRGHQRKQSEDWVLTVSDYSRVRVSAPPPITHTAQTLLLERKGAAPPGAILLLCRPRASSAQTWLSG